MTDADRLDALRLLFHAGGNVSDGARKVVGLVLSRGECTHADICSVYDASRTTAWRWIAEARAADLMAERGGPLVAHDVNVERLRMLAAR